MSAPDEAAIVAGDGIERIIDKYRGNSGALIHALMEIQHENRWLPREVLHRAAEALGIPFSRVLRVATMYKTFSLTPKGRHEVQVCTGISCHLRGAKQLLQAVEHATGIKPGETDAEARFSLETGSCLGGCSLGPEMIVDGRHHARMTPAKVEDVLKDYL
jgi:NADH-quinone oxidoreductase subunit E